jgi:hypothetical protein
MAADSRATTNTEGGGSRVSTCQKLFKKKFGEKEVIIGTAGETGSGLVFVDWYGTGKDPPDFLTGEADFQCLVLSDEGLFEFDKWCRGEKILDKFYSVGSGAKAAMGAMWAGKGALEAVKIAAKVDPYTAGPFVQMSLTPKKRK